MFASNGANQYNKDRLEQFSKAKMLFLLYKFGHFENSTRFHRIIFFVKCKLVRRAGIEPATYGYRISQLQSTATTN